MEHTQDTTSTSTDITGDGNIRVLAIPLKVSSMVQPLDEPLFQQIKRSALGSSSLQSLPDLTSQHSDSESDTSDSSSDHITELLPDLASVHSDEPSYSSDEESDSLPDLVSVHSSDTQSDDTSSSEEENPPSILILDGYFDPSIIVNMDEVHFDILAMHSTPAVRLVSRPRPQANDLNKADMP